MNSTPIVAVFGLSGVGKSWLIERYVAGMPLLHVQASQLLRDAKASLLGKSVTSEELRTGAVLDNQTLLIEAFARIRETARRPIVFDGHCVVDNGDELLEIPVEVVSLLAVSHIIFVEGPTRGIVERRAKDTTRVRPTRSEAELEHQQARAKSVCEAYSRRLGLSMSTVAAGDEERFARALDIALQLSAREGR
jgi:adenylate kinase